MEFLFQRSSHCSGSLPRLTKLHCRSSRSSGGRFVRPKKKRQTRKHPVNSYTGRTQNEIFPHSDRLHPGCRVREGCCRAQYHTSWRLHKLQNHRKELLLLFFAKFFLLLWESSVQNQKLFAHFSILRHLIARQSWGKKLFAVREFVLWNLAPE